MFTALLLLHCAHGLRSHLQVMMIIVTSVPKNYSSKYICISIMYPFLSVWLMESLYFYQMSLRFRITHDSNIQGKPIFTTIVFLSKNKPIWYFLSWPYSYRKICKNVNERDIWDGTWREKRAQHSHNRSQLQQMGFWGVPLFSCYASDSSLCFSSKMKDYEKLSQLAEVLVGYNKKEQLMMF